MTHLRCERTLSYFSSLISTSLWILDSKSVEKFHVFDNEHQTTLPTRVAVRNVLLVIVGANVLQSMHDRIVARYSQQK